MKRGIITFVLLFAFGIGITGYISNKKDLDLEEVAYGNFIEQLIKDKEITDQFYNQELPKDTFNLSKFSLQNNFELCMDVFQSINIENSGRYTKIQKLYNQYWDISTEENPSNSTINEIEIVYRQLLEIHEDIKQDLE